MSEENNATRRNHDPFFRWLFSDVGHLRNLLELAGKVNYDVGEFISAINMDTLVRIQIRIQRLTIRVKRIWRFV